MTLPTHRRALTCIGPGKAEVKDHALPLKIPDDYVLVRVSHAALNPADWKLLEHLPFENAVLGIDFSGTVVATGASLARKLNIGDRVAAFTYGMNPFGNGQGAFADYAFARSGCCINVGGKEWDKLGGFAVASTVTTAVQTCGSALFQHLGLPLPGSQTATDARRKQVLIYGGSTATGTMAIQLAKQAGLEVIATCSSKSFEFVKSRGADKVFDYRSPTCGADINAYTNNSLLYVMDCVAEESTARICAAALSTAPPPGVKPRCNTLQGVFDENPEDLPRKDDVDWSLTWGYRNFGERYILDDECEARPQDYENTTKFFDIAMRLFEEAKLTPHPHELREGGLTGILQGFQDMKDNKVSGVKLVYRIAGDA